MCSGSKQTKNGMFSHVVAPCDRERSLRHSGLLGSLDFFTEEERHKFFSEIGEILIYSFGYFQLYDYIATTQHKHSKCLFQYIFLIYLCVYFIYYDVLSKT